MRSKSYFEPRSPRYGLILVWGCRRPRCTNHGAFGDLLGAVRGHVVELEGPGGPFGTGKSSCMCRVATVSLHLAVFLAGSRAVWCKKKKLFLTLMTLEGPNWLTMGSKWAHATCLGTANALASFLKEHIFDPFLTDF